MDGVLPYTATLPAQGLANAGFSAAGEPGGEGGFVEALNRSMAAPSAEGPTAPAAAVPVPPAAQAAAATPPTPPAAPFPALAIAAEAAPPVAVARGSSPAAAGAMLPPVVAGGLVPNAVAMPEAAVDPELAAAVAEPALVAAQPPKPGKPTPDAISVQPPPDTGSVAETLVAPPPASAAPLPTVQPRPNLIAAPAEADAPAEEEAAAPAEASPLLVPLSLPGQAPVALAASAPAGLSASSPRAEAPSIQTAMTNAQQPEAQQPEALGEADGAPPAAPDASEQRAPEQHAAEKQGSVPGERAPPPTLTAALWQAEAMTPMAGFDRGPVPLRPGEIISAQSAAAATPPPPAARQVASVAVALAFAPNGTGGFSLSLEPAELGRVEIRVQREGDSHSVRVTAERPETLALLQRDRHELDRNLAEAGLRIDAGGIAFSLEGRASNGGGKPGDGRQNGPRGQDDGARRATMTEMEAPPQRLGRSLLDLNI